jgi:hypothetical protein
MIEAYIVRISAVLNCVAINMAIRGCNEFIHLLQPRAYYRRFAQLHSCRESRGFHHLQLCPCCYLRTWPGADAMWPPGWLVRLSYSLAGNAMERLCDGYDNKNQ